MPLVVVLLVIFGTVGLANVVFGATLISAMRWLEVRVSSFVERTVIRFLRLQ